MKIDHDKHKENAGKVAKELLDKAKGNEAVAGILSKFAGLPLAAKFGAGVITVFLVGTMVFSGGEDNATQITAKSSETPANPETVKYRERILALQTDLVSLGMNDEKRTLEEFTNFCTSKLTAPKIDKFTFDNCERHAKTYKAMFLEMNAAKALLERLLASLESKGIDPAVLSKFPPLFEQEYKHTIKWEFQFREAQAIHDRAVKKLEAANANKEAAAAFDDEIEQAVIDAAAKHGITDSAAIDNTRKMVNKLKPYSRANSWSISNLKAAIDSSLGFVAYQKKIKPTRTDDAEATINPIGGFRWNDNMLETYTKLKALNPTKITLSTRYGSSVLKKAPSSLDNMIQSAYPSTEKALRGQGNSFDKNLGISTVLKDGSKVMIMRTGNAQLIAEGVIISGKEFTVSVTMKHSVGDMVKSPSTVAMHRSTGLYTGFTPAWISFKCVDESTSQEDRVAFFNKVAKKHGDKVKVWGSQLSGGDTYTKVAHESGRGIGFYYSNEYRNDHIEAYYKKHLSDLRAVKNAGRESALDL